MRRVLYLLLSFLCLSNIVIGQANMNESQKIIFKNIPQEKIYIHYNSSLLFSGEYLYYKIYNLISDSKELSKMSKVAYVELINQDQKQVFKQKISLHSGIGQADFFINTDIPSGSYKLIAYTKWMRNLSDVYFYSGDLIIINPFVTNKNFIANKATNESISQVKNHLNNQINNSRNMELELDKNNFKTREKVLIKIKALSDNVKNGNYSISIKKIDSIPTPQKPSSTSLNEIYSSLKTYYSNKYVVIPEFRGELISGAVFNKNSKQPAQSIPIAFSINDSDFVFKTSVTNETGKFYFNLSEPYSNLEAKLTIINKAPENYEIKIDTFQSPKYTDIQFADFRINKAMKSLIEERSTNNQIENSYSSIKPNRIIKINNSPLFFKGNDILYDLNLYTRFPTVKETVVEIINELKVQRVKGKNKIIIKNPSFKGKGDLSLLLVDGLYIHNHQDVIDFDARKIDKIRIIDTQYRYGSITFEGIISIETKNKDFKSYLSPETFSTVKLLQPEKEKRYFIQEYDNNDFERIPDYRTQLLWEPNLVIENEQKTLSFYTSDYEGNYEINIEGFTLDGEPVSIKEIFKVKD